jgi:hypothetical protein
MPNPNATQSIKPGDSFEPHGLSAEAIEGIARQPASRPDVQTACLVRKKVQVLTNVPCYPLGIIPHCSWYELDTEGKNQALLHSLRKCLTFPEDPCILVADQLMKHRWINTLKAIPQSTVLSLHTATW